MIKPEFIKRQVQKSFEKKRTQAFLRKLILNTVELSLRETFGDDLSDKCIQGSIGVQHALSLLGISSKLVGGHALVPEVHPDGRAKLGGFWGTNDHCWLLTEFLEFVDLTITQISNHRKSNETGWIGPPPIWWTAPETLPGVFVYKFTGIPKLELPEEDNALISALKAKIKERLENTLNNFIVEQVRFGPILEDIDSLETLARQGDPWSNGCCKRMDHLLRTAAEAVHSAS